MAEREKPFHLDLDFDEALRRYVGTEPREMPRPNAPEKSRALPKRKPKSRAPKARAVKPD